MFCENVDRCNFATLKIQKMKSSAEAEVVPPYNRLKLEMIFGIKFPIKNSDRQNRDYHVCIFLMVATGM